MNPTDSDFRPSDREKLLAEPPSVPKKKGFWGKIGDGLSAVLGGVINVVMAGKGGEDE